MTTPSTATNSTIKTLEEKERLQVLMQCGVLDSEINEADYHSITCAATKLLNAPMASISMIESDRVWLKSTTGFSLSELPRKGSFADHVGELIDPTDMFVVLDAQKFPQYSEYPQVKNPPHIRFYCGTPIVVEGHIVGSICVFDPQPRKRLSVSERMNLLDLAHATSILLTERRNRIISKTSAVDRLVSHLLHDSLSVPLQEMTSSLSLLRPQSTLSSSSLFPSSTSNRPSRAPSIDSKNSTETLPRGVSESLLRQSRSLLDHENPDIDMNLDMALPMNVNELIGRDENNNEEHSENKQNQQQPVSSESKSGQRQGSSPSSPPHHGDTMQDVYVALCQLSSLIGLQSSTPNSPRSGQTDPESVSSPNNLHNLSHQRIQIPLRYTSSSHSSEYLDQSFEDQNLEKAPFSNQNLRSNLLRLSASTSMSGSQGNTSLTAFEESQQQSQQQQTQDSTTFSSSNPGHSNLSSDLHDMLRYLQQVLPVSVSNYRTVWNISLPPHIFQNKQCRQTRCVISMVDVLTNLLETVLTHIIMRTQQLEVTVEMAILSAGNEFKQEYLPNESNGYLLNEITVLPTEFSLTMRATGYMNTFFGGHVTVEHKNNHPLGPPHDFNDSQQHQHHHQHHEDTTITTTTTTKGVETPSEEMRQYDFYIDSVAIEDILSPLGVKTSWKFEEKAVPATATATATGGTVDAIGATSTTSAAKDHTAVSAGSVYDGLTGILNYQMTVPCRVEMTYLPPEEIEKLSEVTKITTTESVTAQDPTPSTPSLPLPTQQPQEQQSQQEQEQEQESSKTEVKQVSLPPPALSLSPAESSQPKLKLRVLIVDDSPAIQKILGKWLQRNDCEVTSALNGQLGVEALQDLNNPVFDLVFMDFLMPVMDGLEAVKTFFEWKSRQTEEVSKKFKQILIIGLSATANVEEQEEGIKVGMNYFIQKPADTKLLRIIIDWKLRGEDLEEIVKRLQAGVVL